MIDLVYASRSISTNRKLEYVLEVQKKPMREWVALNPEQSTREGSFVAALFFFFYCYAKFTNIELFLTLLFFFNNVKLL